LYSISELLWNKIQKCFRSTFLIDGKGVIQRVWRKVKVPGHAKEVLEALKAL